MIATDTPNVVPKEEGDEEQAVEEEEEESKKSKSVHWRRRTH